MNRPVTEINEIASRLLLQLERVKGVRVPIEVAQLQIAMGAGLQKIATISADIDARTGRQDPSLRDRIARLFGR